MSTKYSACWRWDSKDSESVALFSADVPRETIVDFVDSLWANAANWQDGEGENLRCVEVIDMDTGEVIAERSDWDEPDLDWGYNEDMGYDPYMGCYTDDC